MKYNLFYKRTKYNHKYHTCIMFNLVTNFELLYESVSVSKKEKVTVV